MKKTVAILGSGTIGATIAYSLALRCPHIDIILMNRTERTAWARAFDISHCTPELNQPTIRSVNIEECHNADILVITAGTLPAANGSRMDVLQKNLEIFRTWLPLLSRNNPQAVIVNITNPVDIMAYAAQQITGFPPERVIGTGTALDSLRLRSFIARQNNLSSAYIAIDIIGEHGETMVPVWSQATYHGKPLTETLPNLDDDMRQALLIKTRRAGWDIRQAGEHSCFAIAFSTTQIIEGLLEESDRQFLISTKLQGEYGLTGPYLSLPTTFGPSGVEARYSPTLAQDEQSELLASADHIQKYMREVDKILSA